MLRGCINETRGQVNTSGESTGSLQTGGGRGIADTPRVFGLDSDGGDGVVEGQRPLGTCFRKSNARRGQVAQTHRDDLGRHFDQEYEFRQVGSPTFRALDPRYRARIFHISGSRIEEPQARV